MMNDAATVCTCGNFGCAKRVERGMKPLCQMSASAPRPKDWFDTYGLAAAAARPDQKVVSGGGYLNGSPRRFYLVAR